MITGIGSVNGALFGEERSRCAVMGYDYTVFAGTQGVINHKKKDRLLSLADKWSMPVVLFAEGGGGRPGDDWPTPAGLDTTTFYALRRAQRHGAGRSASVSGRCFAGNAALLGGCDVIIADQDVQHRHGRSRDDRGRRPRRVPPGGYRTGRGAGAERRRRCAGRGRGRRRRGREEISRLFPGPDRRLVLRRPAPAAPRRPGEPAARLRHQRSVSRRSPTQVPCSNCGRPSARA